MHPSPGRSCRVHCLSCLRQHEGRSQHVLKGALAVADRRHKDARARSLPGAHRPNDQRRRQSHRRGQRRRHVVQTGHAPLRTLQARARLARDTAVWTQVRLPLLLCSDSQSSANNRFVFYVIKRTLTSSGSVAVHAREKDFGRYAAPSLQLGVGAVVVSAAAGVVGPSYCTAAARNNTFVRDGPVVGARGATRGREDHRRAVGAWMPGRVIVVARRWAHSGPRASPRRSARRRISNGIVVEY